MMGENLYTQGCIRTFTGKYFNVSNPDIDLICVEDIAHSLSQQPRFAGHLPRFYSVAEHLLNCEKLSDEENKLAVFCHDFSEAYILDLPSPIKKQLKEYYLFEERIMALIAKKFRFQFPFSNEVHRIDKLMLEKEWNSIMIGDDTEFEIQDPLKVEQMFLDKFHELTAVKKIDSIHA
jgi:5'-deoxynucleotidase YfbR-like HD superfamily hydrolase